MDLGKMLQFSALYGLQYMILSIFNMASSFMTRIYFDPLLFLTFPKPPASIPPTLRHVAAPRQHIEMVIISGSWEHPGAQGDFFEFIGELKRSFSRPLLPFAAFFFSSPEGRNTVLNRFQTISSSLPTKVCRNWDITSVNGQVPSNIRNQCNGPVTKVQTNTWQVCTLKVKRRAINVFHQYINSCQPLIFHQNLLHSHTQTILHNLKILTCYKHLQTIYKLRLIIPYTSQTCRNNLPLTSHNQP
jgi:hypothetical protein